MQKPMRVNRLHSVITLATIYEEEEEIFDDVFEEEEEIEGATKTRREQPSQTSCYNIKLDEI